MVALATAVCTAVPVTVAAKATHIALDASTSCHLPGFRESLMRHLRAARAGSQRCGREAMPPAPPLAWNDALFSAAALHSADMARRNYFDHVSPEGARAGQRVSAAGYPWRGVAENIAGGEKSVDGVMAGWMRSAGHCSNIMEPRFTDVAVACVERPGSRWGTYWTMVLGRNR
ncbi:CAP domain-containing protein [Caenimonas aquaedulcis]|uniref:CAP domain-containing protein n=1 Tax=Caenimonas aquaedulcis TaxID=2793270 RepID=A0A931H6V3_9BURK|nr:CAP domain-containing protein [Caenimonas aquaedulcis]MBG9389623.1 CAP domain-containing protein [Caenimonas aquaedulcis]